MKIIKRGKDARLALKEGAEIMYDCVATTLGPKGRNVALARQWGYPLVVHDGVTVAREVEAEDEFVQMGVNLIKEAAQKTNQLAGDGTTTATLLAYHLVDQGMKLLETGINPMVLRMQLETATTDLIGELAKIAHKTTDTEDVKKVAFVSSQDPEIGQCVAEAMAKVGKDGLVTVEQGKTGEMVVDYTEGMEFARGYSHPYFITDPQNGTAVIQDPAILVLGKQITMQKEIVPLLEVVARTSKNIVLLGDIQGDALKVAIANKVQNILSILVCDVPGDQNRRKENLEDIAIQTGATVVTDELGLDMDQFVRQFDQKWIGHAKTVIADKDDTIVIDGQGEKSAIQDRIDYLKNRIIETEKNNLEFERERLEERLAKMTTGVAVVRVGGKTDIDLREKVERVKDAIGAAKAVLDEGIVPGGGVAFLQIRDAVWKDETSLNDGQRLLFHVLEEPLHKLLLNAGENEEAQREIIRRIRKAGGNNGYNVNNGHVGDMIDEGVIDPAKVLRLSLENAVAVAGSILTTDCLIVEKRPPETAAQAQQ